LKPLYNTAVKGAGNHAPNENRLIHDIYHGKHVSVLQHDVCSDIIPEIFRTADAIYTEPAWENGYEKFTDGSIADGTTFNAYMSGIKFLCKELSVPAFLVCGKSMIKYLQPDSYSNIEFVVHNNYPACCAMYGFHEPVIFKNENEIRDFVFCRFNNVLDFSCGYGNTALFAEKHKKHCILSDINVKCIEYIIERWCKNGN